VRPRPQSDARFFLFSGRIWKQNSERALLKGVRSLKVLIRVNRSGRFVTRTHDLKLTEMLDTSGLQILWRSDDRIRDRTRSETVSWFCQLVSDATPSRHHTRDTSRWRRFGVAHPPLKWEWAAASAVQVELPPVRLRLTALHLVQKFLLEAAQKGPRRTTAGGWPTSPKESRG
jgi:hypothetical protein